MPLESVSDNHVAACGKGIVAILIGRIQMVQSILPPAHVQGIAVREKYPSAQLLNQVRQNLGIIGPQIRQIARLPEMNLDGRILVREKSISVMPARLTSRASFWSRFSVSVGTHIRVIHL